MLRKETLTCLTLKNHNEQAPKPEESFHNYISRDVQIIEYYLALLSEKPRSRIVTPTLNGARLPAATIARNI